MYSNVFRYLFLSVWLLCRLQLYRNSQWSKTENYNRKLEGITTTSFVLYLDSIIEESFKKDQFLWQKLAISEWNYQK